MGNKSIKKLRHLKSFKMFEGITYKGMISLDTCVDIFFEIIEEEQCHITLERRIVSVGEVEKVNREEYEIYSSSYELKSSSEREIQKHPGMTTVSNIASDVFDIHYGSDEKVDVLIKRIKSKLESILNPDCSVTVSKNQYNTIISIVYPVGTVEIL